MHYDLNLEDWLRQSTANNPHGVGVVYQPANGFILTLSVIYGGELCLWEGSGNTMSEAFRDALTKWLTEPLRDET